MLKDFEKPNGLADKTFDNFEISSPEQSTAIRVVKGLLNQDAEVNAINGLWLWSRSFGTGKTHLLAAMHDALDVDPERKLWISPVDTYGVSEFPLSRLMHGTNTGGSLGEYRRLIENAQAIFIDELTVKKIGSKAVDFINFFQLAYEKRIKLFASSNHPLDELGQRLERESEIVRRDKESQRVVETENRTDVEITGRIQSRLTQLMTPIEMLGKDYREILALKALDQVAAILKQEQQSWQTHSKS